MKRLILPLFTIVLGTPIDAVADERASSKQFKTQYSKIKKQQQGRMIINSDENEASNEAHHYNIPLQEATLSSARQESGSIIKNIDLEK